MAHVEKRGKDRWRARYRAPDGRERSRTFARRSDADRFLSSVTSAVASGEWVDPNRGRITVGKWLETLLAAGGAALLTCGFVLCPRAESNCRHTV
jgi:hypothetical protein